LRAAMRPFGTKKGVVAIEDNKSDAVEAMRKSQLEKTECR
jgi:Na+-translocating ferredoxin:NAD+ oxidoreductase RnfC subunit